MDGETVVIFTLPRYGSAHDSLAAAGPIARRVTAGPPGWTGRFRRRAR